MNLLDILPNDVYLKGCYLVTIKHFVFNFGVGLIFDCTKFDDKTHDKSRVSFSIAFFSAKLRTKSSSHA